MKIRLKLILWFLIIASLIGGSSFIAFVVVSNNIKTIVEVENPKVLAVLEMEINVDEIGQDVLDYLKTENIQVLDDISDANQDYTRWHDTFESLITSDEEKELLTDMDIIFTDYNQKINELIDIKEKQVLLLQELRVLITDNFDPEIDEGLQKGLKPSDENFAKKQEALLEMEINVHELVSGVRDYVLKSDVLIKNTIDDSVKDYLYWEAQFLSYQLTQSQQEFMENIIADFKEIELLSLQIIDLEDQKNNLLLEFKKNRVALDSILDDQLQTIAIKNIQKEEELVLDILNAAIASILISFIAVVILGIFISNNISRPIIQLQHATDEFAKGNMNVRSNITSKDEIGSLASSFDSMTEEVKNARMKIEVQLNELKTIDEQKDEFAAMVSHELKTPLVPAQLYTEMLLTGVLGSLDDKQLHALHSIHNNIELLNELVEDLLDVTKLELGRLTLNKKQVDIKDLLNKNFESWTIFAKEKKIALELDLKTSGKIFCDPKRINQIISNLIKNSIDFVPENIGLIKIKVEKNAESFVFSVQDNGPGIPVKNQKHLFQKFYKIDTSPTRKHGGTGLGLTVCHGLVKSHGGKIWLDNGHTQGTCLKFTIPLVKS